MVWRLKREIAGLDIGLWQRKSTGPPKTCNDPNVFAAGICDFTREVAHFCTLGLYITKNKYELTLPSEFCRFPVNIMAAYEALKKTKKTLWWPELVRQPQKGMRDSGHIANVKAWIGFNQFRIPITQLPAPTSLAAAGRSGKHIYRTK